MQKKPIISIDLIIRNRQRKILLGKLAKKWRGDNKFFWGLPGHELLFGEKLKDCIKRNLREEVGMEMITSEITCINTNFGYGNHYITIGILVRAKGKPINKNTKDWVEWKWFNKKDIPSKLFPSAKLTLKSFFENKATLDS
jgi:ADP-ribose pyrophosphatase YjhB (NUDIX family)